MQKTQYLLDLELVGFYGGLLVTFPTLMKIAHYLPLPFLRNALASRKRITMYAEQSLQRHYKKVEEEGDSSKPTLFSKLYKAREEGLEFKEVRDSATSYIVAGSDTTANTLTYIIWLVCTHPEVKKRLLKELETLPENFEDKDLKPLPYLGLVITETLRLYSAVPAGLPRIVPKEGATFAGHWVPGGYTVSAPAYSMHRNPNVFSDPLTFDPSRWERPTQKMKDAFVPYGGGSRGE